MKKFFRRSISLALALVMATGLLAGCGGGNKLGGNSKGKIYGRLDCGAALDTIKRFPGSYEPFRVFFSDENTALAAGYRPCGRCMREQHRE